MATYDLYFRLLPLVPSFRLLPSIRFAIASFVLFSRIVESAFAGYVFEHSLADDATSLP